MIQHGRVAVITGAGRGLGQAAALRLAAEGADVVLVARSAAEVEAVAQTTRAAGTRAVALPADVTRTDAVDDMYRSVMARFGRVDIIVNSAGALLYRPLVPLPDLPIGYQGFDRPITDDEWNRVQDVNIGGAMRILRAFGPCLLERRYGRVVNVVSNVVRRTVPFTCAYDTTKGALNQLTRSIAREWARYGVTVNAIAAGHFPTAMTQDQFGDPQSHRRMLRRIPAARTGEANEFAALVAYLCGEESGFITGETIALDGGETL